MDYIVDVLRDDHLVVKITQDVGNFVCTVLVDDAMGASSLVSRYANVVTSIEVRKYEAA